LANHEDLTKASLAVCAYGRAGHLPLGRSDGSVVVEVLAAGKGGDDSESPGVGDRIPDQVAQQRGRRVRWSRRP
jgi:hypothetical protein